MANPTPRRSVHELRARYVLDSDGIMKEHTEGDWLGSTRKEQGLHAPVLTLSRAAHLSQSSSATQLVIAGVRGADDFKPVQAMMHELGLGPEAVKSTPRGVLVWSVPVYLLAGTDGKSHLYVQCAVSSIPAFQLLEAMVEVGVIDETFAATAHHTGIMVVPLTH